MALCQDLDLPLPTVPRQRRPPKRYTGLSATHVWTTADDYFRSHFFQLVDTAVSQLKLRYEQPGLHRYARLEQVLLHQLPKQELSDAVENYPELDSDRLAVQLEMMRQQNWELTSVDVVATKLLSVDPVIRKMFDQIEQLVRLLLTIPSSSAEAERSFSSLRRLKNYLRSRMKQNRLNHLTVLHVQ